MALLAEDHTHTLCATVAGILLCSSHPETWLPHACIKATCYRGPDRSGIQVGAQDIVGPLDRQISQALAFIIRNMPVAAIKDASGRKNYPGYSTKALFEAIVNAPVHRDYTIKGSKIRLSMFHDRLELQIPGSLPNSLTVESITQRQSTRNEALVSVLSWMPVKKPRRHRGQTLYDGRTR